MIAPGSVQIRLLAVVVILASLAFGFVVWWGSRGGYARQPSESVVDCQDRYQQAATFRDTAAIDLSYPTAYWQHTSSRRGPQTCGELRIAGRLR